MVTITSTIHCLNCDEKDDICECKGCLQIFCYECFLNHRETINQRTNQLQDNCNLFRENLIDQKNNTNNRPSIEFINKWENESIDKIKNLANKYREKIINYTNKCIINIENNLNNLSEQSKQIRKGNKLNENLLIKLIQKLEDLKKEFHQPTNLLIKQQSKSFINKINIITPFNLDLDNKWEQYGLTIAGGIGQGNQINQFSHPFNIAIDDDQTIYIADRYNHRIIEWKSNLQYGRIVAGGNGQGKQTNQLDQPTDVIIDKKNNSLIIVDRGNRRLMRWSRDNNTINGEIIIEDVYCWGSTMDKDGSLYVSDTVKNEVRRWKIGDKNGIIVAGGNGEGDQLNQFNIPTSIFVDEDYSLYVSDSKNHRVMKWEKDAEEGIIVAGGNGEGDSLTQLSDPEGVFVNQMGQIYVVDWNNHRVMCWCEGDKEGTIIVGGNGQGEQSNQFHCPSNLSFDFEGNLYVADCLNHRIQKFEID